MQMTDDQWPPMAYFPKSGDTECRSAQADLVIVVSMRNEAFQEKFVLQEENGILITEKEALLREEHIASLKMEARPCKKEEIHGGLKREDGTLCA
ncbi:hypothetical protein C2845_PM09G14870 [Panicum miliaceum]|uniref:Uncharacterized protein n=1 Tax=Panicum miliaceum TaxID=4540 RepID=A0A3L6S216_PANMI|nr:hypothetical protein C2845_PM09G14870 [Panicum miliaceum]